MADSKLQDLTDLSVPALADGTVCIDDPDGSPLDRFLYLDRLMGLGGFIPGGRLTLTTGVPVTTADVTAAGTLYYTPYLHDRIRIYDGTRWKYYSFSELSLSLTLTAAKPYDVWVYDNSGTLTLEVLVWTNATTRATALTTQDGVYVKTGATTRLYLGTVYASGTNTLEDSIVKRFVWNMYNRVPRTLSRLETTASWTWISTTVHQANAAAANQVEVVTGLLDSVIDATIVAAQLTTPSSIGWVGFGEDSTTAMITTATATAISSYTASVNVDCPAISIMKRTIPLGYHYYAWLEVNVNAIAGAIWYAANGTTFGDKSGILGHVLA